MRSKLAITLFIFTTLFIITLVLFSVDVATLKNYAEIFQNFGIGTGTFLAGFSGLYFVTDYFEKKKKQAKLGQLLKQYSWDKLNETYKIIASVDDPGRLFIYDLSSGRKHWIASYASFKDLILPSNKKILLPKEEFEMIPNGEPILTSGEAGT